MKKAVSLLTVFLLAIGAVSCSTPAGLEAASPTPATAEVQKTVEFADPVLEAKVHGATGRPEGDITTAEAEAVTEMNFGIVWPKDVSGEEPIRDLSGLEYFKNLESLNLSSHAVTDISPLAGLTKLTLLSLSGNPVADISPLSGMTSLRGLNLSGCAASDYSSLASLVNLEFLVLDGSAITDISVLSGLTGLTYLSLARTQVSDISSLAILSDLKQLYLADCPIATYSPLADIYANLEGKDFTIVFSLTGLGFTWPENDAVAEYRGEGMSVTVNHSEWGASGMEDQNNAVKMNLQMDNGYGLTVIYYPEIDVYVFQMTLNNQLVLNYIYDPANGGFTLSSSDRESAEQVIKDALGGTDADDILLAPLPIFNDAIKNTFGITADALYALPFEQTAALPPEQTTMPYALPYEQLGFTADTANAVCIYEQHEPHYMRIAIQRPEWGENPDGFNIMFNDSDVNGYYLVIMYFADEGRYHVSLDKGGVDCSFDIYPATDEKGRESPDLDTVHQMFNDAFGTQGKELYHKPLDYFEHAVQDRFGMSIEELYALPVGE